MHCLDEIGDLEDYERNGILRYLLDLKAQERDYSVIASLTPKDTKGTCVYCKHCHPCPAGLDIGLINKYYDLSRLGDVLAKEHYLTLEKAASDCLQCGHCNSRCPFSVDQMARMEETISSPFSRRTAMVSPQVLYTMQIPLSCVDR